MQGARATHGRPADAGVYRFARYLLHFGIAKHFCDDHYRDHHCDDGKAYKDGHPPLEGRFFRFVRGSLVRLNDQLLDLNGERNLLFLLFPGKFSSGFARGKHPRLGAGPARGRSRRENSIAHSRPGA